MSIDLYEGDLPAGLDLGARVAVDTEAMGLNPLRDRLCLVQLSSGDGCAHLVQLRPGAYEAPRLAALLSDPKVEKLFHFARFDIAIIKHYLKVDCTPLFCTKIASRLVRTYTDRHGLRDLCRELLEVELSKAQQSSDWGAPTLTARQREYAASDVLYLHALRDRLEAMLIRDGRYELARAMFAFLPTRAALDLAGWGDVDIFAHA